MGRLITGERAAILDVAERLLYRMPVGVSTNEVEDTEL
jgi:hypothetical protein